MGNDELDKIQVYVDLEMNVTGQKWFHLTTRMWLGVFRLQAVLVGSGIGVGRRRSWKHVET